MNEQDAQYTLEDIVDAIGLTETVQALSLICSEKAEHIRTSYDDRTLAAMWDRDAKKLMKFSEKLGD